MEFRITNARGVLGENGNLFKADREGRDTRDLKEGRPKGCTNAGVLDIIGNIATGENTSFILALKP